MKKILISLFVLFALSMVACAPKYTINHSMPVKPLNLPADKAAHNWAQSEWWYYTGHLKAEDGQEFGYELTFFKRVMDESKIHGWMIPVPGYWVTDIGMVGHFAITDLPNKKFQAKSINNLFLKSKADDNKYDVMIDKWTVRDEKGKHVLYAEMKGYQLALELEESKSAVPHGANGIVKKGGGYANYYYSFTNMKTSGTLTVDGKPIKVTGKSWMDHEYGTLNFSYPQIGWDWYSIQLDNNCELMLYFIRHDKKITDKNMDDESVGGTFIGPDGDAIWLKWDDIDIKNLSFWHSEQTDSNYPASWEINIKSQSLKLNINPVLTEQELDLEPFPYWEGAVSVIGTYKDLPVKGQGYIELTGYSKKKPMY
jgi:predicted secreted hydrolase